MGGPYRGRGAGQPGRRDGGGGVGRFPPDRVMAGFDPSVARGLYARLLRELVGMGFSLTDIAELLHELADGLDPQTKRQGAAMVVASNNEEKGE